MKLPSYIRQTKFNTHVFRRRIPKHLLQFFTTEEIRISLSKLSRPLAIMYSRVLAFEAENLFYRLENSLSISETPSVLMRILQHKKELMAKDEKYEELENLLINFAGEKSKQLQTLQEHHRSEISTLSDILKSKIEKPAKTLKKSILLSAAIDLYFDEAELKRRKDKPATIRKDRDVLKLFTEIIGDKELSEIKQPDAVKFAKEAVTHGSKFKLARAESTVNGFMNSVSKFSAWITAFHSEVGHVKLDFSKLRFKKSKKASEERPKFTDEEALKIFNHPEFIASKDDDPAKYWLINIAAYSGARLEEISQMNPSTDIYQEDGVWVYDINEEEDKSLKNDPSIRKVPIHSEIIRIGFLDYVETLKLREASCLFPDELIRDGRIGKNAGKRVSRFIQHVVGIKGKSLHCFRHSVFTKFKRALLEEAVAAAVAGHEHGGITYTRYGKEYAVSTLKSAVELINYA